MNTYLLYYDEEHIEDSIIIPNKFIPKDEITDCDRMDNYTGVAKMHKGGYLFSGKNALRDLKYQLRMARDAEYGFNGDNMNTPKKEVTSWISSLSYKVIVEQEINRLTIEMEYMDYDNQDMKHEIEVIKGFIPKYQEISNIIGRMFKFKNRTSKWKTSTETEIAESRKFFTEANQSITKLFKDGMELILKK